MDYKLEISKCLLLIIAVVIANMSDRKRKLNVLSLSDKVRFISDVDKGVKKKKELAADFGILPNILSTIIKTC